MSFISASMGYVAQLRKSTLCRVLQIILFVNVRAMGQMLRTWFILSDLLRHLTIFMMGVLSVKANREDKEFFSDLPAVDPELVFRRVPCACDAFTRKTFLLGSQLLLYTGKRKKKKKHREYGFRD